MLLVDNCTQHRKRLVISLYWLQQTAVVLPLALWIYLGLGIPYALLLLPRSAWARKADIIALGFAFGPAILSAWAFILGTIGGALQMPLLRFDLLLGGTVVFAIPAMALSWLKLQHSPGENATQVNFAFDEKLLIGLVALLYLLISVVTAYWTFTAYDTLWVYGYLGRLYQTLGYIPEHIGYYPQFLPLQYAFMQLAVGGFDDHAARVIVPFLYLGSILAAYGLGARLFSHRVGIFTAAIWALYPHASQWAQSGDLEIPLTFLFTLSASYFLQAWLESEQSLRRRYALIAGLCFGIAMWTKPTAGAFIYAVVLLVALNFLFIAFKKAHFNVRELWKRGYPRFEVAMITGLACLPLGSVWYLRNILLGLPPLVFPHPNWLSLATRSGDLLSWPLLALFLLLAYLAATRKLENAPMLLLGVLLVLVGALPSSPLFDPSRRDAPMSYIRWYEAISIIVGLSLIAWNLRKYPFPHKIAWTYLLALPYFLTWFWSYSYHARLSFAIVPLLIVPSAVVIAQIQIRWKRLWSLLLLGLALYGFTIPIWGIAPTSDWLWTNRYPDDQSKYLVHNGDIYQAMLYISGYQDYYGISPIVIAPGEQRLPFFLPETSIITNTVPTDYVDIAGATHFLYGTLARWRYRDEGIALSDNRILASLERLELFKRVYDFNDGNFTYELYELSLENRFEIPSGDAAVNLIAEEVIFADSIRYLGASIGFTELAGNNIHLNFLWQALTPMNDDYYLRLSLLHIEDNRILTTWDLPFIEGRESAYSTRFWELGEYVLTRHEFLLTRPRTYPRGQNIYRLLVNLIDSDSGESIPLTVNGALVDAYALESLFSN